jgi:hypothetical protein
MSKVHRDGQQTIARGGKFDISPAAKASKPPQDYSQRAKDVVRKATERYEDK